VYSPRGTNYSNLQENQLGELHGDSFYIVSLAQSITAFLNYYCSNPGYTATLGNNDGLVPTQRKFSGMHTHTHTISATHPLPCQMQPLRNPSKTTWEKQSTWTMALPPKRARSIETGISGPFHELNCPAEQPSVGRVAVDYANMTTCSGGPLPVAANSKLKSLKSSHPNKRHANMDHPSPIRYTQTDIWFVGRP
jgi:hypothetical protein